MDDTIQRVLTNLEQFKLQRQLERRRRERLKCLHLVVAVVTILLLAGLGVAVRVTRLRYSETWLQTIFLDSLVNKPISQTCERQTTSQSSIHHGLEPGLSRVRCPA